MCQHIVTPFTDEEIRVLKLLAAGVFSESDPAAVKDLVLRGYVTRDGETFKISFTGRVALSEHVEGQTRS